MRVPLGLVMSILDASVLDPSIQNAVQSGIPVVSMNSGSDVYEKLDLPAHVGRTEFEAGLGGGKRMAARGVEKAICVEQEIDNVALDLRFDGFENGLGGRVEVVAAEMDPTEIEAAAEARHARTPDLEGVLALGPSSAEPALAAIEEAGFVGRTKIGTSDLSPTLLAPCATGRRSSRSTGSRTCRATSRSRCWHSMPAMACFRPEW